MKQEQKFLLDMVSCALNQQTLEWQEPYADLDWELVKHYILWHSVSVIALSGVLEDKGYDAIVRSDPISMDALRSVYLSENQVHTWHTLKELFESHKIDALPLKGMISREYYPDPNYRSMGDLDILYKPKDHDRLKKAMEKMVYSKYEAGIKHDHYLFKNGIHVEMHRDLVDAITDYETYYESIWERVHRIEGTKHIYEMSFDDHYIFTVVHMKEHIVHREFMFKMAMDLYVLNRSGRLDRAYVEKELKKIGLYAFEENVLAVVNRWFSHVPIDPQDPLYALSELLIDNREAGSATDVETSSYASGGSKWKYYQSRLFPTMGQMKSYYSWLEKAPVLLPAAWMMRFVSAGLFRRRNIKTAWERGKSINFQTYEKGKSYRTILEKYGIKK